MKNTMLRLGRWRSRAGRHAGSAEGTTAIAISTEDRIAAARILCKYADASKGKFSVKTGYMDGAVMDKTEVGVVAKLPGLEGMLSMFAGALTSTLSAAWPWPCRPMWTRPRSPLRNKSRYPRPVRLSARPT